MKKRNILISNDDGIKGPGLKLLINAMSQLGRVYTIVPEKEMSGASQSITLFKYKQLRKCGKDLYILKHGTPVDCVKFGLYSFLKNKIDLVVSGINSQPNLGQDVIYSGTVGCAREGACLGIPSIAFSVADSKNPCYEQASRFALQIAENFLKKAKNKRPADCLNVNIPPDPKGIKTVPLGIRSYDENIQSKKIGNDMYYCLAGRFISGKKNKGADIDTVQKGFISVTPILFDQTDYNLVKKYQYL